MAETALKSKKKRDAFTEVHADYYPLVFSTVYTKVGNLDDAQDICQEVFIKLYEKFEEVENPRKWLYGALRLAVLEYFRKKRGGDVNIDEVMDGVGMTFVNGFRDSRIIIREILDDANLFADELDRAVFELVAYSNFSYSEAGRELGLSKRQVEYRYVKLAERILDELKKRGVKHIEDLL